MITRERPPVRRHLRGPLAAFAVLLQLGAAAAATPQCYRPAEIEAEQAVRFQTELMVLSDTCRTDSYRSFMTHNSKLVARYQEAMVERFRRLDGNRAEAAFDRYVTKIANDTSLRNGQERYAALCSRSADFLTHAGALDNAGFSRYVGEQVAQHDHEYRRCTP